MLTRLLDWGNRQMRMLNPELAHQLTILALRCGFYKHQRTADDPRLHQKIWGLDFNNPLGMAAGFDKNAQVPDALIHMGFGFVEVGSVTPRPQKGNARPRVFRLPEDRAVINRYGFNNDGHAAMYKRLAGRVRPGVLGVNVGANKDSQNRIEDFVEGLRVFIDVADYLTVNVSSPNTPGLRELQDPEHLNALLSWLTAVRKSLVKTEERWRPILVKLAPDLDEGELEAVTDCLIENEVDGIIISNTTVERGGLTNERYGGEIGGLSGRPLFRRSTEMLAKIYLRTEGKIPLIGVGGVDCGAAALAKIGAGASLVQLYTGLVYEGPGLINEIKQAFIADCDANGYTSIAEAVGRRAEAWASGTVA